MRILFLGESDNGITVSSQNARAFRQLGVGVEFDAGAAWDSPAWRETCGRVDLIQLISYGQSDPWLVRKIWLARLLGIPVVRMWVGTDVLWACQYAPARRFAQVLRTLGVVNLTVADHLGVELLAIGIRASTVPIIADFVSPCGEAPCLPARPTALAYLCSDYRREFYGGSIIDEMIARRPDVGFLVVHDGETDYRRWPNVESLGLVRDMTAVYARTTVLVRPTAHDGMPRMMLEALSFGRHAICSYPYPHCLQARTADEFLRALDVVLTEPGLNLAGREHVLRNFNRASAAQATADEFERLARKAGGKRRAAGLVRAGATLLAHWDMWRGRNYLPREVDPGRLRLPSLAVRGV